MTAKIPFQRKISPAQRASNKSYYWKNRDSLLARNRIYREQNRAQIQEQQRENYRRTGRRVIPENGDPRHASTWPERNPDRRRYYAQQDNIRHRIEHLASKRAHYRRNRNAILAKRRTKHQNKNHHFPSAFSNGNRLRKRVPRTPPTP